jgi:hypothetical protein
MPWAVEEGRHTARDGGDLGYPLAARGASTREQRPGLAALLDYAREGDAIVVVGIDRLGRYAAEVMTTIRELGDAWAYAQAGRRKGTRCSQRSDSKPWV